jgi:hypothetical protein
LYLCSRKQEKIKKNTLGVIFTIIPEYKVCR